MATHSSVLAWRIPGTGEPVGLPSMGSQRVRHNWSDLEVASCIIFSFIKFSFKDRSAWHKINLINIAMFCLAPKNKLNKVQYLEYFRQNAWIHHGHSSTETMVRKHPAMLPGPHYALQAHDQHIYFSVKAIIFVLEHILLQANFSSYEQSNLIWSSILLSASIY